MRYCPGKSKNISYMDVGLGLNNFCLRNTPPCADGNKPQTCADGSTPSHVRGSGGKGSRCPKSDRICCDGSTPTFDGDWSTPPCADGNKPKCTQEECV